MRRPFRPESDWRWPFSWYVTPGQQPPYTAWIIWHYHCLLPRTLA